MLVLQKRKQFLGDCELLKIGGRIKILDQGFAVSWSSAHSTTIDRELSSVHCADLEGRDGRGVQEGGDTCTQ